MIDFSADPERILLCNYPSNQIVSAIARDDLKVLLLLEPSADTQQFMQQALGVEPLEAIRSQSASAVANLALGRCRNIGILEQSRGQSMLQLIDSIGLNLGLSRAQNQWMSLADQSSEDLGPEANVVDVLAKRAKGWSKDAQATHSPDTGRAWSEVCGDVIDGALAMALFGSARPIVWPTEVFSVAAPRSSDHPTGVALTGQSRNIYYGPYFYLPPSSYRVEIFVNFSSDATPVPFSLEVHAGAWLSRTTIDHWRPGRFRGAFDLVHTDATTTVEIRLRNLAEISRGSLSLVEVLFYAKREESL